MLFARLFFAVLGNSPKIAKINNSSKKKILAILILIHFNTYCNNKKKQTHSMANQFVYNFIFGFILDFVACILYSWWMICFGELQIWAGLWCTQKRMIQTEHDSWLKLSLWIFYLIHFICIQFIYDLQGNWNYKPCLLMAPIFNRRLRHRQCRGDYAFCHQYIWWVIWHRRAQTYTLRCADAHMKGSKPTAKKAIST